MPGERTREVTLDPGASADTPVRGQGPGGSLPGPDAGHPLRAAAPHDHHPIAPNWYEHEQGDRFSHRL
jgi:hypothetical protein